MSAIAARPVSRIICGERSASRDHRHHCSALARRPLLRTGAGAGGAPSAPTRKSSSTRGTRAGRRRTGSRRCSRSRRRAPSGRRSPFPSSTRPRRTGRARRSFSTPRRSTISHGSYPKRRETGESNVAARDHADHKERRRAQRRGARAGAGAAIIKTELKLESKAIMGFAMTLSEVCQNIIEHAGQGGWVAVQTLSLDEATRAPRRRDRRVRRGARLPPVARERAGPCRRPTGGTTPRRSRRR